MLWLDGYLLAILALYLFCLDIRAFLLPVVKYADTLLTTIVYFSYFTPAGGRPLLTRFRLLLTRVCFAHESSYFTPAGGRPLLTRVCFAHESLFRSRDFVFYSRGWAPFTHEISSLLTRVCFAHESSYFE